MILNLTKNIVNYDKLVKSGNFVKKYEIGDFYELFKKILFRLWRIGSRTKRCLGFGNEVYVYDPFVSEEEINKYNCISIDESSGFEINYISIHLPLNKDKKIDFL